MQNLMPLNTTSDEGKREMCHNSIYQEGLGAEKGMPLHFTRT